MGVATEQEDSEPFIVYQLVDALEDYLTNDPNTGINPESIKARKVLDRYYEKYDKESRRNS